MFLSLIAAYLACIALSLPMCTFQVFLSLVFDEDLRRSEPKEEEKVKPRKKNQRKNEEKEKKLSGNGKRMSKHELAAKTREEVCFPSTVH